MKLQILNPVIKFYQDWLIGPTIFVVVVAAGLGFIYGALAIEDSMWQERLQENAECLESREGTLFFDRCYDAGGRSLRACRKDVLAEICKT